MKVLLEDVYKKVVTFLNREKFEYIIIGGIAAGILGEPRLTGDVDVDIVLKKDSIGEFLSKARKEGFNVDERKSLVRGKTTGVFQIRYGDFHVDFIIASIDLEREAIKRKKVVRLYRVKAFFPTPEDFILLKIVPARPQDIADIEKVVMRNKGILDVKYLEIWGKRLSDEAQDMRMYNDLKKLLDVK
ncbi:MAG: hypothetical protein A2Y00_09165 [Omnitrophica WOR_2 bacterium GWF2_43_52]|nr:MAG: hypothetical protein A2062_00170 [Omnitrophica WOR_2 bacterium GWA2_44_7]OGX14240.1 MAG: hypothetical protein A2Y01_00805 [Omnitrophica WOR_2 bacterium GWC2_44_8]OGX21930.1 MAG: hypothetical protein A2Y00_09165 [Omnitrophica WOR_2 bacterium GWF2_43_52]OGX58176.1 MAG: hypothetical protein A2460_05695 [Omnitrophica WOR_2 bacterium RIFOXYC2_FULL_43_9]HAH20062.1 hypothetical protein [Candidatus Omnitrophota bacterium]